MTIVTTTGCQNVSPTKDNCASGYTSSSDKMVSRVDRLMFKQEQGYFNELLADRKRGMTIVQLAAKYRMGRTSVMLLLQAIDKEKAWHLPCGRKKNAMCYESVLPLAHEMVCSGRMSMDDFCHLRNIRLRQAFEKHYQEYCAKHCQSTSSDSDDP